MLALVDFPLGFNIFPLDNSKLIRIIVFRQQIIVISAGLYGRIEKIPIEHTCEKG